MNKYIKCIVQYIYQFWKLSGLQIKMISFPFKQSNLYIIIKCCLLFIMTTAEFFKLI